MVSLAIILFPIADLVGDIFSEGDFRIEGNIKGNIKTSRNHIMANTAISRFIIFL